MFEAIEGTIVFGAWRLWYSGGGAAPVQIDGELSIDESEHSWPIYFRSRGTHMSLSVFADEARRDTHTEFIRVAMVHPDTMGADGDSYDPFVCSYLEPHEARVYIRKLGAEAISILADRNLCDIDERVHMALDITPDAFAEQTSAARAAYMRERTGHDAKTSAAEATGIIEAHTAVGWRHMATLHGEGGRQAKLTILRGEDARYAAVRQDDWFVEVFTEKE